MTLSGLVLERTVSRLKDAHLLRLADHEWEAAQDPGGDEERHRLVRLQVGDTAAAGGGDASDTSLDDDGDDDDNVGDDELEDDTGQERDALAALGLPVRFTAGGTAAKAAARRVGTRATRRRDDKERCESCHRGHDHMRGCTGLDTDRLALTHTHTHMPGHCAPPHRRRHEATTRGDASPAPAHPPPCVGEDRDRRAGGEAWEQSYDTATGCLYYYRTVRACVFVRPTLPHAR
jgi:hypothetical protein